MKNVRVSASWPGILALALCLPAGLAQAQKGKARGKQSPSAALAKADREVEKRTGYSGVQLIARGPMSAEDDKTLAPYFHIPGADDGTEALPLKETRADVRIAGVIARVKVHQLFENTGTKPIEAVYVFPASTRAAVHGMRMKIGDRTVEAKIERREKARADYEQARTEGKRASLLEQERPNVFTMNVANIMPGDRIQVTLDYSELLVPDDGVYELVYPTVVGPRYGGGANPDKDQWIANPYLKEGNPEPYKFDIAVHMETGMAIQDLTSPSHKIDAAFASPSTADVKLAQAGGGNKDFILRYRLADNRIESGLLLYEEGGEGYFTLMLEPPQRPTSAQIPPREYIFVLDVSGSMHGFPLDTAKALMRRLLGQLRAGETFNIVLFSGTSFVLSPKGSMDASEDNIKKAMAIVDKQRGGGGTELLGGLKAAYNIPRPRRDVARTVVVVTDGYVGVEAQAFKFIRDRLDEANLFSFGIGSSVNRGLIEGMARAGMGEPFVVLRPEKAEGEANRLRQYIEQPVLTQIDVDFAGFDAVEVAPRKVPDLMARRPVVVLGKYKGEPKGEIRVTGYSGGGKWKKTIAVRPAHRKASHAPIRVLWARKWVELLDDARAVQPSNELEDAITDLGLDYSLLTSFTSFVAIDSEVVNKGGDGKTVKQPLPLPEGVSDLAVGGARAKQSAYGGVVASRRAPSRSPAPVAEASEALSIDADEDDRGYGTLGRGRGGEKSPRSRPPASLNASVRLLADANLTGAEDLAAKVKQALEGAICGSAKGTYRVRLTVDRSGRNTAVKILSGRAGSGCLKTTLRRVQSAARAAGAPHGTLEIEIRLSR